MRDAQRRQGPEARHKALAAVAQQVADLARSAMAQLGASEDMATDSCERCHDKQAQQCWARPNRTGWNSCHVAWGVSLIYGYHAPSDILRV